MHPSDRDRYSHGAGGKRSGMMGMGKMGMGMGMMGFGDRDDDFDPNAFGDSFGTSSIGSKKQAKPTAVEDMLPFFDVDYSINKKLAQKKAESAAVTTE